MVITAAHPISSDRVGQRCWNALRRFHDVEAVTALIVERHNVSAKHKSNARKQAEQIRYCLIQAKEYFDASQAVTLATSPVLLYYSLMSLALAEILLKQDGKSSLEAARETHAHHGLTFSLRAKESESAKLRNLRLALQTSCLRAVPTFNGSRGRFGTFELWHRSAREYPGVGELKIISENHDITIFKSAVILQAADVRMLELPNTGINLLDCIKQLPSMEPFLASHGVESGLARSTISGQINRADKRSVIDIVIHPQEKAILEEFYAHVLFKPSSFEYVDIREFRRGVSLRITSFSDGPTHIQLPIGCQISSREMYFASRPQPLNEFGFYYVAMFMAGSLARYYPDIWLAHLSATNPLALAIEELVQHAAERAPLLTLAELSQSLPLPH